VHRDADGLPASVSITVVPVDRFAHATYPAHPGHAAGSVTSIEAAEDIDAGTLRAAVLEALRQYGDHTPDELADLTGHSVLAIRPRCTELKALGLVRMTGATRPNRSGKRASVLTLDHVDTPETA
jgi:hypothetical protein